MSLITYANLTIDGQGILIPQSELIHREQISNINPCTEVAMKSSIGFIGYGQANWPVYALDSAFSILENIPSQRQLVVCIASGDYHLCIACDAATTFENESEFIIENLPEIMHTRSSPIQALLYDSNTLHFITSAKALIDYLLSEESGN